MRQKLHSLLRPKLGICFLCLALFAVVTGFFHLPLALVEGGMILLLCLFFLRNTRARERELNQWLDAFSGDMDTAVRHMTLRTPLPMVIFRVESGELVWANEHFVQITGERSHLLDTALSESVPQFPVRWLLEGKTECPQEVTVEDRQYLVFGHLASSGVEGEKPLAITYWMDVTEYSRISRAYYDSRPVAAILLVDNYEEIMNNVEESLRSAMLTDINNHISRWVEGAGGLFLRYDRDRYLFLFEESHLPLLIEGKFSVLDNVREVVSPNGVPATLSIGMGREGETLEELFRFAALSIDMALSRGGDQAVIKDKVNFDFYGGRSKAAERRTKVKSRVMANAMGSLVSDSSLVLVMGHRFPDLDAFGACAGVSAIARKLGVPCRILRDPGSTPADEMIARLTALPEYQNAMISEQEALSLADDRTLLVVVDTNRPDQVQAESLLERCRRVAVIDHHRRAATYISNAALNFHEPYASSACELVTELVQYLLEPSDLLRDEGEALMAGIMLDTKNFVLRTGGRTFEAAAFLRRTGADTKEVKKLFQSDLASTVARYDIIRHARTVGHGVALAATDQPVGRVTAAQAADELLSISGVDASFVLSPGENTVFISGRSMGEINVQVILEALGGGGNAATAGAQVEDASLTEAEERLTAAIERYFEKQ